MSRNLSGGSHRAPKEPRGVGLPSLIVAGLVMAVAVVGGFVVVREMGRGGTEGDAATAPCGDAAVTLAASPEIAEPLKKLLVAQGCSNVAVEAQPAALVSRSVSLGDKVPDLWIPDSSLSVARATSSGTTAAEVLVPSLATSPIVVAGTAAPSWREVLADDAFVMGDPLTSTAAGVPLLVGPAGLDDTQQAGLVVPLAQEQAELVEPAPDDAMRIAAVAKSGGSTAVSEQLVLALSPKLKMSVPQPGTYLLDYPLVLTAGETRKQSVAPVAAALAQVLRSPATTEALNAAHFRAPDAAPVTGGVGRVTVLPAPNPEDVGNALRKWATLALPTRSLAVIDVSGSMDFPAGQGTRMDLLAGATTKGLELFPDTAAIGLWIFSEKLGNGTDYKELLPVRTLASVSGGKTQRDLLLGNIAQLNTLTTGGTGLYDTTLAAFRTMQAGYDPRAVNSVILFTDGANEDPGSITLDQLLSELERLKDPARPVSIVTIGITDDADAESLAKISKATGAVSVVARQPEDIGPAFIKALGSRTG